MIGTAYYYQKDGYDTDPKYEMSIAIPNFGPTKYGILAGPAFTVLFSSCVLFTGILSDNLTRRYLLGVPALLWSVCTLLTAFAERYWEVAFYRMLLGIFEAFVSPVAYSLIVDYFPPQIRTRANSLYAIGISIAKSLVSLSIILIGSVGWRAAYAILGVFGMVIALAALLIVRDPTRGTFGIKKAIDEEVDPFCKKYCKGILYIF